MKGFVHAPTEAGAHDPQAQGEVSLTWAAPCPLFQQADTQACPLCTHSHARVSARGPNCPRPIHSSQPAPQVASSPVGETESPGRNDDPPRRFRDLSQQAPLTLGTPRRSPELAVLHSVTVRRRDSHQLPRPWARGSRCSAGLGRAPCPWDSLSLVSSGGPAGFHAGSTSASSQGEYQATVPRAQPSLSPRLSVWFNLHT